MSAAINYYKTTLRQLIDHIVDDDHLSRSYVPLDSPYPRVRHIYGVASSQVRQLYILLDCFNLGYYTNRFNTVEEIPTTKIYFPSEILRCKPVELLDKIDERRFEFIRDILNVEYIGCLNVGQDGGLLNFYPSRAWQSKVIG